MTIAELLEQLEQGGYPLETVLYVKRGQPVTGLLFDPPMFGVEARLEFQIDEP
jgi:hypothetical protein